MRIALVTRHLGIPAGLGTYARNLLRALDRREDEHEYVVYAPAWNELPPLGPRFRVRRSPVPRGSRAALTLWDVTAAPLQWSRDGVDIVHYLHSAFPLLPPRRPVVVNVLDAIGWVMPGYRLPQPYDWLQRRAARRADLLLTLSENAREDIARVLGVPRAKIRVTYLGGPPLESEARPSDPYFLFVGGTEKRKNLTAVLDAFGSLEGFELRVVGPYAASPVHDAKREQPGVRWLGYVSEDELAELYRRAIALVFPSRYEGFGLPLLEAMARRTPVIAAGVSSIPEVARGAALLVDPDDVEGLCAAMRRVAAEPALRAELTRRGAEVVSSFSWDETARSTVAAYEELGPRR